MATTYRDVLERWAQRWVAEASDAIHRQQRDIADIQCQIGNITDPSEKAGLERLIEDLEDRIDELRRQHQGWQRRAKRRWGLDIGDLTT